MNPQTRADAMRELLVASIAWRIARTNTAMSWEDAKCRAYSIYPAEGIPPSASVKDLAVLANEVTQGIVVGAELTPEQLAERATRRVI